MLSKSYRCPVPASNQCCLYKSSALKRAERYLNAWLTAGMTCRARAGRTQAEQGQLLPDSHPPHIWQLGAISYSRHALQGEGPAIFKPSDGNYYMMASHLTFWRPNPAMLFHAAADSLATAKWSQLARPAMGPGANTTYNSQSSSVFTLRLASGAALHIYMGDRWNFYGPGSVSLSYNSPTLHLSMLRSILECFLLTSTDN